MRNLSVFAWQHCVGISQPVLQLSTPLWSQISHSSSSRWINTNNTFYLFVQKATWRATGARCEDVGRIALSAHSLLAGIWSDSDRVSHTTKSVVTWETFELFRKIIRISSLQRRDVAEKRGWPACSCTYTLCSTLAERSHLLLWDNSSIAWS